MRDKFAGKVGFILAMAGSAIGLGNIWRFPFLVGENGGALFILLYIIFGAFVALPAMICESVIGRRSGQSAGHAFKLLKPDGPWKYLGLLCVLTTFIIGSYYSVVGGWSINYLVRSFLPGAGAADSAQASEIFSNVASTTFQPLLCFAIFLVVSAFIVGKGITKGIESFSKFCMPVLAILIVFVAIYSCCMPGASEGIRYLVKPDFSQFKTSTVVNALGQAFFSMSLGVGTVITYSSFMDKKTSIAQASLLTWICDTAFAIIAGFAVLPAVYASGLSAEAGPSLVFETFPYIFGQIMMSTPVIGRVLMIIFFLTIILAALTSELSLLEVCVEHFAEKKNFTRRRATITILVAALILGAACALSFGVLADFKIFGMNLFSLCDTFASNIAMTVGALLTTIFAGWVLPRTDFFNEFTNNGTLKTSSRLFKACYFLVKWVVPIMIILIIIFSIVM